MRIEFDTATATPTEAAALIAVLALLFPDVSADDIAASTTPAFVVPKGLTEVVVGGGGTGSNAAQVFTAEPEAAAVFAQPVTPMPNEAGVPFAGTAPEADGSTTTPPSAPAPAAATGLAPAEVDSAGLPWDARIHTGTKTKNKDGSWRQKRDLDPAVLASVTAELRAAMGAPAAVPPAPTPAVPASAPVPPAPSPSPATAASVPPAPPAVPSTSVGATDPQAVAAAVPTPPPATPTATTPVAPPTADAAPATPPPTVPTATPAAPASAGAGPTAGSASPSSAGAEFARVMQAVSAAQVAGKVETATVSAIVAGLGLPNLAGLLARPDLIPSFEAQFNALIGA